MQKKKKKMFAGTFFLGDSVCLYQINFYLFIYGCTAFEHRELIRMVLEDTVFGGIRQGPWDLTRVWKEVQTVGSREEKNRQWMPDTGEGRRET